MDSFAAQEDTWGISGPAFVDFYLVAGVVLILLSLMNRIAITANLVSEDRALTAEETAYLGGGARLAVIASLAGLRAAGSVDAGNGRLSAVAAMPAGASALDQAVYDAASRRVAQQALVGDPRVTDRLADIQAELARMALLYSPVQRGRIRFFGWSLVLLAALGVVRTGAGIINGRPVGVLVMLTVLVAVAAVMSLRRSTITRRGRERLEATRAVHGHLDPSQAPSMAVYGMAGAAMGVALYGAGALWTADPTFAAEAEVQRNLNSTGHPSGTGSSGDAGGGGCGGGCGGCGCGG